MKKPLRSSAAIYMYVSESMIKFLPLSFFKQSAKPRIHRVLLNFSLFFSKCSIQRVSDFYTLQSLNTCVDCAIILLVQFDHINDREGRGVCVSVVLLVKF